MFDFRRIILFCLEKRLSKHKMTILSKHLGGHGPFGPPGYAYGGVKNVSLTSRFSGGLTLLEYIKGFKTGYA